MKREQLRSLQSRSPWCCLFSACICLGAEKITSICQNCSSVSFFMRQWEVQIISLSNANTQREGEKRREGGRRRERGGRGGILERVGEAFNHCFIFRSSNFIFWVSEGFGEEKNKFKKSLFFFFLFSACKQIAKSKVTKKKSENLEIFSLSNYLFANSGTLGVFRLYIPARFSSTIGLFCQPSRLQCV